VLAVPEQIAQLAQAQSPWAVNHLARWAASLALADQAWQAQQRDRLVSQQERLLKRLDQHHFRVLGSCAFFAIITDPDHQALFTSACEAHILLRYFPELQALRLGLPQREGDWYRLEQWMAKVKG
jgi:cobalamin biosynthetic protein CobC